MYSPTRYYYYDNCYVPPVDIKEFNALICNKTFFDQSVKTNK